MSAPTVIKGNNDKFTLIEQWCNEQFGNEYDSWRVNVVSGWDDSHRCYRFRNEKDAVLFALRWA